MKLSSVAKATFFSLLLSVVCFHGTAQAAGPTCHDLFSPKRISQRPVDKAKLRAEVSRAFAEQYQVATDTPNLIHRMIVWNATRKTKLNSQYREQEIRRSVAKTDFLMSILARASSGNAQFLRTPEERWFQREVMSKSLMEIATQNGLNPDQASSIFRKLSRSRALKFLVNPLNPPDVADRAIPAELLQKVLMDGPERHYYELRNAFQESHQGRVDRYRSFARMYRLVSTALVVYFAADYLMPTQEERRQRQLETLDADLEGLGDFLDHLDQELTNSELIPLEPEAP